MYIVHIKEFKKYNNTIDTVMFYSLKDYLIIKTDSNLIVKRS